jgi:hypothetical protein
MKYGTERLPLNAQWRVHYRTKSSFDAILDEDTQECVSDSPDMSTVRRWYGLVVGR